MIRTDYAITPLAAEPGGPVAHTPLTRRLGCTDVAVDAYRLEDGAVTLSGPAERLVVAIGAQPTLRVADERPVPTPGLAFVPAGRDGRLDSDGATTCIVVSAEGEDADREPAIVDPGTCEFAPPATSDVRIARLTAELGCSGMKVNLRRLDPGQAVPYHTEGRQEELFVPLTGPGVIRAAGRAHEVPLGSVTRVAPETPRAAVNEGTAALLWAMVGAPPTGDPDGWDPGATILEWPGDG